MGIRGRAAASILALALVLALLPTEAAGSPPGPDSRVARAAPPSPPIGARKTDSDRNKIFDDLERTLAVSAASAEVPVIVAFSRPLSDSEVAALLTPTGRAAPKRRFESVPGMALSVPRAAVSGLAASPLVRHVELDGKVHAAMDTATEWFGVNAARTDFGTWGDLDGNPGGFSKDDVVIAVIDTGIEDTHPDLGGGKVLAWLDLVNSTLAPGDDNGHGTHVAGIIAGMGVANPQYTGVAPGAALVGIKVLDSNGDGYDSDVVEAIDWAIANKDVHGIEILNLSLGTSEPSDGTDMMSLAVDRAVAAGLVVVVAAGNQGPAAGSVGSPGAAAGAITVGSVADPDERGIFLARTSSRGPTLAPPGGSSRIKPDLVAPGVNITSTYLLGGYAAKSGTSMATPFAAGVAALVLATNPALTPASMKDLLASTVVDWGRPGQDNEYGHGAVDTYAAVAAAAGPGGANPVAAPHSASTGTLASRGVDWYTLDPTDGSLPIAATLINEGWSSGTPKLSVALFDASGSARARSPSLYYSLYNDAGHQRQETISVSGISGPLRLAVYSLGGAGSYSLDVSGTTATRESPPAVPTPTPTPVGWTAIFSDDAERAPGEPAEGPWIPATPWAISDGDYASPSHAWAVSPYFNQMDVSLISQSIDLAGVTDPRLRFQARYELEQGSDYLYVDVSTDGGTNYQPVDPIGGSFTGISPDWQHFSFSLAGFAGSQIKLRFRLFSDSTEVGDGWWLDDVAVEGFLSSTPTATPTATPSTSPTPTATATATPSPTPSSTPSPTASSTPSPTPTATPTSGPALAFAGRVSLQRPQGSDEASRQASLLVSAFELGTGSTTRLLVGSAPAETDPAGYFVANLPVDAGSYDLSVKGDHTLGRLKASAQIPAGPDPLEFGLLLEGDVTGDNQIDILDFAALAQAFGKRAGEPAYDLQPNADLNQDGLIDISDLSLMASNFSLSGDLPAP